MPGREEHPAAAGGFEEVHQVVAEVVDDALAIGLRVQRADIDHVVADEQVGPGAGLPAPTPKAATLGPMMSPGRATVKASAHQGEVASSSGKTSWMARLLSMASRRKRQRSAGDVVGGADDLHAQAGVAAEFPEDAAADLRALAVIARQFDERMALLRQHALEFDVDRRHFQLPAARDRAGSGR